MSEKLYKQDETTVILNVRYSKIGFGYPRLFVKMKDGSCVKLDFTVQCPFTMKPEEFEDWEKTAKVRTKEQFIQDLIDSGLKFTNDKFDEWMKDFEGD